MSPDLESSIAYLQSTNDHVNAYFSFTVDETGEYGIIKANKEGLRLYAAEMLKKSLELEKNQDGQPLFFGHLEWVVSDSGYDLIAGIMPQYQTRTEILTARKDGMTAPHAETPASSKKEQIPSSGCFFTIMMWVIAGLILLAAHKAFPNLHPWESIH
ncbi:MAG TPA: hypothetical protein VHC48_03450 [Puia sp.]|nr:hypothetical protein [Puia sp.]